MAGICNPQKLLETFCVDNCVTSVENEEQLKRFMFESQEILSPAKFNLRGWEHTNVSAGEKAVHRIFDTIGFTCPVTLQPKILLQECWKLRVTWDAELPSLISRKFEKWKEQLRYLNDLEITRCLSNELSLNSESYLHLFCDASKKDYSSCIFLRTEIDGIIACQLVQARARVVPIKATTKPRLKLLAYTIGSRLLNTTKIDLGLDYVPVCCWSDSVSALWIKGKENWGTLVNNRVQKIRRLTNSEDWQHIAGILNPAELPSRSCYSEELTKSLWWEGPSWLKKPRKEWPLSEACPDFEITNSKRLYWPLAKVIKLIPSRDGRVRVVEVSTASGSLLRPIQRLITNQNLTKLSGSKLE
ncbi:unnamed protein product [Larinioides sclopetarius]|uniref:DUF5641 domain-containing protein n=1 Tax=Larinioides sclopetarius TaxID=280406 RepID=A0AAV1ZZB5_9ARAC